MGQTSKRSSKRSTSGWDEQWKDYIRKRLPKKGACNLGGKEGGRTPCIDINLIEYKNTSSLDLTKECYFYQIVLFVFLA